MSEDKLGVRDDGPAGEYTEEIPCCKEETINLPSEKEIPLLKHEDGMNQSGKECTISTEEKDGFERIHEWDHYTREVLNNILIAIEEKQRLGYFDSLIDVETNCNLINIARNVYVDLFNEDESKITKEDIDKQCRGGYSTEFIARMYKLLVNQ